MNDTKKTISSYLSYWEDEFYFQDLDHLVIGSGIVGLHCALELRRKYPKDHILIVERGRLPLGASTKNAGFACFGCLTEIWSDINLHGAQYAIDLVKERYESLQTTLKELGKHRIDYKRLGGHEVFYPTQNFSQSDIEKMVKEVNILLSPLFPTPYFEVVKTCEALQNFEAFSVYTPYEGQLNPMQLIHTLHQKAYEQNIKIIHNLEIEELIHEKDQVKAISGKFVLNASKVYIATNGFAQQLGVSEVQPARAQVLITSPIQNLKIEGNYHFLEGYYYFRNVGNRILFGGGRQLNMEGETTDQFGHTDQILNDLRTRLQNDILPNHNFTLERIWSGIMGVGKQKTPIIKLLNDHVACGVRLGGMGIAIGSSVGKKLANMF